METGAAAAGRRNGSGDHGLSLSAPEPASGIRSNTGMFCHITENWRGRPLSSLDVIVNLISNTTTRTGLVIHADWDINAYAKGIRVSKDEMTQVQVKPASFHGEWNYTIVPRTPDMEI